MRVNKVFLGGTSTRGSLGLLNLTHRVSHEEPLPLIPDEWTEAQVDLDDIAHCFAPGNRIAVAISGVY